MAYTPSFYNPYGLPQYQQSTDGLIWIEGIEGAQMYPLPPNSTSPPLMFKNESKFAIKTTDGGGAGSIRVFSFTEDEPEPDPFTVTDYVTKSDFESFKNEIMEAINGKPAVPTE